MRQYRLFPQKRDNFLNRGYAWLRCLITMPAPPGFVGYLSCKIFSTRYIGTSWLIRYSTRIVLTYEK